MLHPHDTHEPLWATPPILAASALILDSFRRIVGRPLLPAGGDGPEAAQALFEAPVAVLAHGVEADPVFFYGNATALRLFDMDFAAFTRMPSRLSAEPLLRAERQQLMERAAQRGYIDDYAGVRISRAGARFHIENVILWTLRDAAGASHGQAACIPTWRPL